MKRKFSLFLAALFLLLQLTSLSSMAATAPNLQSVSVILLEESTGKILYEKNAHQKMYPASTLKILTALVALENADPNEMVTIGNEVLAVPLDASKAGHVPGEQMTLKDLLAALLLPSGNDSAFSIASFIAKKVENNNNLNTQEAIAKFATLMNEKAKEFGATNSNFVNPSGYHDDNNYTTAYDLSLIVMEGMKNPLIKEILGTTIYTPTIGGTTSQQGITWRNRNLLLETNNSSTYYSYATGGKTGFTDQAGECLVASATKDDMSLISILLNSPTDVRWNETKLLFDYGFENYILQTLVTSGEVVDVAPVEKATKKGPLELEAAASTDLKNIVAKEDLPNIQKSVEWNQEPFEAPIAAGTEVGTVKYTLNGELLGETKLTSITEIEKQTFLEFIFSIDAVPYWGGAFGFFLIVLIILFIIRKRKNRGFHFR